MLQNEAIISKIYMKIDKVKKIYIIMFDPLKRYGSNIFWVIPAYALPLQRYKNS